VQRTDRSRCMDRALLNLINWHCAHARASHGHSSSRRCPPPLQPQMVATAAAARHRSAGGAPFAPSCPSNRHVISRQHGRTAADGRCGARACLAAAPPHGLQFLPPPTPHAAAGKRTNRRFARAMPRRPARPADSSGNVVTATLDRRAPCCRPACCCACLPGGGRPDRRHHVVRRRMAYGHAEYGGPATQPWLRGCRPRSKVLGRRRSAWTMHRDRPRPDRLWRLLHIPGRPAAL